MKEQKEWRAHFTHTHTTAKDTHHRKIIYINKLIFPLSFSLFQLLLFSTNFKILLFSLSFVAIFSLLQSNENIFPFLSSLTNPLMQIHKHKKLSRWIWINTYFRRWKFTHMSNLQTHLISTLVRSFAFVSCKYANYECHSFDQTNNLTKPFFCLFSLLLRWNLFCTEERTIYEKNAHNKHCTR